MIRSCDKCKLEFLREHDDQGALFIDMELCGWYVDEVKCICRLCMTEKWKPDSHRCKNCGKPIFTAWYRQKLTNFNAAPHSCGYEINYAASRPHRIAMVSRTYWPVCSKDDPNYERPERVYVQHRCRKRDIDVTQGKKMLGFDSVCTESPVNQITQPFVGSIQRQATTSTSQAWAVTWQPQASSTTSGLP